MIHNSDIQFIFQYLWTKKNDSFRFTSIINEADSKTVLTSYQPSDGEAHFAVTPFASEEGTDHKKIKAFPHIL